MLIRRWKGKSRPTRVPTVDTRARAEGDQMRKLHRVLLIDQQVAPLGALTLVQSHG
jgi:hypothetical protein